MDLKTEIEIKSEYSNIYDYWKIVIKRKKIFLGVFLAPIIIAIIIASIMPRYYKGECDIAKTVVPAQELVKLIGNIDETKKEKIFKASSKFIKNIQIKTSQQSSDTIHMTIEARAANAIPQYFKDLFAYVNKIPEITDVITKTNEDNDFKIKKMKEMKKANLVFLDQITDMMKKRQLTALLVNPADLIELDADLSKEIKFLEQSKSTMPEKMSVGTLKLVSIQKPSKQHVIQIIIVTAIISFMAAIALVFFLNYLESIVLRSSTLSRSLNTTRNLK